MQKFRDTSISHTEPILRTKDRETEEVYIDRVRAAIRVALTRQSRAVSMHWLRSQGRAISQPAEEPAKPRKLQENNPRQTRANSSEPDYAPVRKSTAPLSDICEWEEVIAERARPSWADADSISSKVNKYLRTMKPIGQYPSPAEYKSVGLTPPPKHVLKRSKLAMRDGADDSITGTPITPVAEEGTMEHDNDESGIEKPVALNGSVESIVGETIRGSIEDTLLNGAIDEDTLTTNLATPVSEALDPSTLHPSFSPAETPLDTPVDELLTDPVLTAPETHLTAPDADSPLHQTQSPPATAVVDGMAAKNGKAVSRDVVAVLNSLPDPTSSKYDVQQLKRVVELAISHSAKRGDDDVALSLVYYWSGISGDDFKLSLIHNIGRDDTDHNLELALKTMLRHSVDDATKWYKSYSAHRSLTLSHQDSDSDLSSAKSLEAEPLGQTPFKVADIYRDTSGPKLEEAFLNGKTNTAPLKRAKKPCRVNENSFKRRREWEADPSLEDTLQKKRTRLSKDTPAAAGDSTPESSSVRPKRGEPNNIEQPYTMGQSARERRRHSLPAKGTATDDVEVPTMTPSASASRTQRAIKERQERQKQKEKASQHQKVKERRGGAKGRARSLSMDSTHSHDSDVSNSVYSVRINNWTAGYPHRLEPGQVEPPENSDNCYKCDRGGNLLCCDTCSNAFHFRCVRPAVDPKNPPKGEWHCVSCVVHNCATKLIRNGKYKKKTEFNPPKDIKEYFAGVGEKLQGDCGCPSDLRNHRAYEIVPHLPRLTKAPKYSTGVPAYNDANLLRLMDNGRVILCNKCGLSTDNERPIIRCDYCPSRFHLDCLDPPRANPPDPAKGWMCPNHVRSDEMIVSKMVDGRLQERRVRRPKNCVTVDVDVLTTDDPRETTFDEDWREKRARLPAGDFVLDFVSAVRDNKHHREREYFTNVANTAITVAKQLTREHLSSIGISNNEARFPSRLQRQITDAIESMRTGNVPEEQFDAATSLLGLHFGGPISIPPVGETSASVSSQDAATVTGSDEPTTQEESQTATQTAATDSPAGDETAATITPAETGSRRDETPALAPRHKSLPRSRRTSATPKATPRSRRNSKSGLSDGELLPRSRASTLKQTALNFKKKRSRHESEEPANEDQERAQKRQHTESD